MKRQAGLAVVLTALTLCTARSHASPDNIVFPSGARVVDVTRDPYYADNSGASDVTGVLQRVIDDMSSNGWAPGFIYLPNGTYRVSGTLAFPEPPQNTGMRLWGQSTEGTVIRLADGTWPSVNERHIVLKTGDGVAQCFCRGVHNLTVNTGNNNAGAIGVAWFANNEGLMSDVNIISEDGSGFAGMDLTSGEQGPSEARNILIRGFQIGIWATALNAVILRDITLENQSIVGILNENNPLYIDSLVSVNTVEALRNRAGGHVVLVNARLTGGSHTKDAIRNEAGGVVFLRDIVTQGYRSALYSPSTVHLTTPQGMNIAEWSSHGDTSLFVSPQLSLHLEEKRPPDIAWEQDMGKWAVVNDYQSGGRSDAQAFQAAIDDPGKTTVCLPFGLNLDLSEPVYVRGNISRIVGTGAEVYGSDIIVVDGQAPAVKIHNLVSGDRGSRPSIVVRTGRTVVLEMITHLPVLAEGTGELFIDDIAADMQVTNPSQKIWAWHYNAEGDGTVIETGQVRIFGWKSEHFGTKLRAYGGSVEILGFLMYAPCGDKPEPMFVIENTEFSLATMSQMTFCDGALYEHLVRETRDGTTRNIYVSDNPRGYNLPLYLSHNRAVGTTEPSPRGRIVPDRRSGIRRMVSLDSPSLFSGQTTPEALRSACDLRGRAIRFSSDRCRPPRGVFLVHELQAPAAKR